MTTYRISAPDGKTYQIEGPEGATQDQVKAEVMRQNPQLSGAAPAPAPARGTAMGESYTNPFGAATAGNPLMALAGAYLKPAIEAAPSSAGGLSRGFMEMIASPVQTASGLLDVAAGGLHRRPDQGPALGGTDDEHLDHHRRAPRPPRRRTRIHGPAP